MALNRRVWILWGILMKAPCLDEQKWKYEPNQLDFSYNISSTHAFTVGFQLDYLDPEQIGGIK